MLGRKYGVLFSLITCYVWHQKHPLNLPHFMVVEHLTPSLNSSSTARVGHRGRSSISYPEAEIRISVTETVHFRCGYLVIKG